MSKERDLLKKIHYCWVCATDLDDEDPEIKALNDVMREAEHYLFHEPVADKPVAWMRTTPNGDQIVAFHKTDGFEPLYTRPEPEAEPVHQIAMAEGSTSTAWIDVAKDVFDDAGMYPEYKRRALYTRPEPSRKPMTDEEIAAEWANNCACCHESFAAGIRFAEKHHGISEEE